MNWLDVTKYLYLCHYVTWKVQCDVKFAFFFPCKLLLISALRCVLFSHAWLVIFFTVLLLDHILRFFAFRRHLNLHFEKCFKTVYIMSQNGTQRQRIIIIIIIIAFKGAIRDFFTIFSQRRELSPTHMLKWPGRNRVQIMCAYHVQVSCYVPLGMKGQLSY